MLTDVGSDHVALTVDVAMHASCRLVARLGSKQRGGLYFQAVVATAEQSMHLEWSQR